MEGMMSIVVSIAHHLSSQLETDFELLKYVGVGSFGTVHDVAARLKKYMH
jgi:hypothetical protein